MNVLTQAVTSPNAPINVCAAGAAALGSAAGFGATFNFLGSGIRGAANVAAGVAGGLVSVPMRVSVPAAVTNISGSAGLCGCGQ